MAHDDIGNDRHAEDRSPYIGGPRARRSAARGQSEPPVWGLLYDPSRFAGLQVVLQSLLGGGLLVAPDREGPGPSNSPFLQANGCTHLSATPTLWRKILMTSEGPFLPLRQITLGGEIADDPLLAALATRYPEARVTHIYASTEAGVGFSVKDGRAGLPVSYLADEIDGVGLKIVEDVLWLRPPQGAADSRAASIWPVTPMVSFAPATGCASRETAFISPAGKTAS